MEKIIDAIRLIGTEFEEMDDDEIESWANLLSPLVSKTVFGDAYTLALAYLVCHKMKMAGYGINTVGGISVSASTSMTIGSISEGGSSISFSNPLSGGGAGMDAEYSATSYGVQYLQLRKTHIIPITISR